MFKTHDLFSVTLIRVTLAKYPWAHFRSVSAIPLSFHSWMFHPRPPWGGAASTQRTWRWCPSSTSMTTPPATSTSRWTDSGLEDQQIMCRVLQEFCYIMQEATREDDDEIGYKETFRCFVQIRLQNQQHNLFLSGLLPKTRRGAFIPTRSSLFWNIFQVNWRWRR